jgi:hypothetical protein
VSDIDTGVVGSLKVLDPAGRLLSKDDLLMCDATDKANPSCSISFNPVEVKIETVPSCERIAAQEERKKPRENQAGQKADITWTPDVKR